MVGFIERKALGDDDQCLDRLDDEISVFFGENCDEFNHSIDIDCGDDESDSGSHDPEERVKYWESQEALLQEILAHNSSMGSKLRREVSEAVEMARETALCCCPKLSYEGCASCLRQAVVNRLCDKGFNASLCTSKWKSTRKIPGGIHEYIDVIVRGPGRKKETKFLIELDFRAEFEMTKACDGYRMLLNQLPKTYIGKSEHLNAIVRIICDAAKRSMKEKKIHMGPWRKRSFMQMKWSGSYQRWSSNNQSSHEPISSRQVHMPILRFSLQFPAATAVEVT